MVALDNGHNGVARLLMERGGNPHVWDVYGRTALYIAVGNASAGGGAGGGGAAGRGGAPGRGAPGAGAPGRADVVRPLLQAQARRRAQVGVPVSAPVRRCSAAPAGPGGAGAAGQGGARGGQGGRGGGQAGAGGRGAGNAADSGPQVSAMEMINLLLAAGVDTNAQLNMRRPSNQGGRFSDPLLSTGTTPLLRALINNDTAVARLLLEKGANPNIYGMGLSPWLYAAGITSGTFNEARGGGGGNVDTELLDLMLEHGADVNAQVTGAASYSGRIARALTGDPVNTKSNEGMTALHVAVRSRNASSRPLPARQGSANRHQGCVGKDTARRPQRRAGVSACCICRCGWRRASQSQCRSCRSCGSGARGRRSGGWCWRWRSWRRRR